MSALRIPYYSAALVILCILLLAGNWYVQPERIVAWSSTAVLLAVMMVALGFAIHQAWSAGARQRAADAIRSGVTFASLVLASTLGVKLATALGALGDGDVSQRASMAIIGLFFVWTGNALPKSLTPLSEMQCGGTRTQAFQRFAGWTWVVTGLVFSAAWLMLPVAIAKPVSLLALASGVALIVRRLFALRNCAGVPSVSGQG
jgi:hypothetical protein